MAAEQLNTASVLLFGALLGVIGVLFFIVGGMYPLLRVIILRRGINLIIELIPEFLEFLKSQSKLMRRVFQSQHLLR